MMSAGALPAREPGLLKPAVLWLLLLAPLFFSTYGFATWVTAQRDDVGSLVFDWERHMPFWAWTIVPYWSIDLLYGFSLLLPRSRDELKRHALRLLTAQLIAVSCFLLWPLRFTFPRPELDGVFGWLFEVLTGFDKPFNQAPSLHIALLVVLWVCYARHTQGFWRWLVHGWFGLIGVSVLTTYQHHFVDVPTGALAGWLCVWLWPLDRPSPLFSARLSSEPKRRQLAWRYGLGALLFAGAACAGGAALWLIWPAVALLLVALNYALLGAAGFQKRQDGSLSPAARWLLAPYLAAAWINSRLWTKTIHSRCRLWITSGSAACRARHSSSTARSARCSTCAPSCPWTAAGYRLTRACRSWTCVPPAPSSAWRRRKPLNACASKARCWCAAPSVIRAAPRRLPPGCCTAAGQRPWMRLSCRSSGHARRSSCTRPTVRRWKH